MNKRIILALFWSFCILSPVLGQSDSKDDVIRITTRLVQVDAVVTKDGKPVTDLKAEDFEIYQDGRRQTITNFAYISNVSDTISSSPATTPAGAPAPPIKRDVPRRTIAIVVDDLGLSAESMSSVRKQLRKFIREQLQPNDLVAIIRTGGEMGALQQFTNDRLVLERAVNRLRWNACSRVGISVLASIGPSGTLGGGNTCGGWGLLSTMTALRFILDAMAELPGRKSMILLSDDLPIEEQDFRVASEGAEAPSFDNPTFYSDVLKRIAEKAIRSSVVIYSVDTQGLQVAGITAADSFGGPARTLGAQMNAVLASRSRQLRIRREGGELIAKQTGGFQIRNSNDFRFERILGDQSGYYLIGYRPSDETFNKRFHRITAKVKRSGMSVRTRFGFYGVTEEEAASHAQRSVADKTNLALLSPFGAQELELDLTSFFANDEAQGSFVRSFIYLDGKQLTFTPANNRQQASLEVHGVIFGDNGRVVEKVTHRATLNLREEQYQKTMSEGLRLRFDMPAKRPGAYQVRIAVRDGLSSKIGSAGQFVTVPDLNKKQPTLSGIVLRGVAEAADQTATMASPAIRRFTPDSDLYFALMLYNANPSQLMMEAKLFHDGKIVTSMPAIPIDATNPPDPSRLFISSMVHLAPDLEAGHYYLQVVITDKLAQKRQPPVVQWIDFEIVLAPV